jgi:arylformamidase
MKIYDISHTLSPGIAVWPGDLRFRRTLTQEIAAGDPTNGSALTLSSHVGTHLDAPAHYMEGGRTIDGLDLSLLVGPARLVTVAAAGAILPEHLATALVERPSRLLVRANPPTDLAEFPTRFTAFSEEAARAAVAAGVRLLGIDAPSVDLFEAEELPVHRIMGSVGGVILENLKLAEPPDGLYQLIALPLKIAGGDGSPVRAVLTS